MWPAGNTNVIYNNLICVRWDPSTHPPTSLSCHLTALSVLITGNVFVIAAIILERNLQNVANYLVASLAVADLLVACLVMPLGAVYEVGASARGGDGVLNVIIFVLRRRRINFYQSFDLVRRFVAGSWDPRSVTFGRPVMCCAAQLPFYTWSPSLRTGNDIINIIGVHFHGNNMTMHDI